jgi:hypothetical protein
VVLKTVPKKVDFLTVIYFFFLPKKIYGGGCNGKKKLSMRPHWKKVDFLLKVVLNIVPKKVDFLLKVVLKTVPKKVDFLLKVVLITVLKVVLNTVPKKVDFLPKMN